MKIAILTGNSGYRQFALKVCETVGAETVELEWTENIDRDVQQLKAANPDYLFVQGHVSHHGFRVARRALVELKIEPVVITTAHEDFVIEHPISRVGGNVNDTEEFNKAVKLARFGPITGGGAARLVIKRIGEVGDRLAHAKSILVLAEQAMQNAQEAGRKYLKLADDIRNRKR